MKRPVACVSQQGVLLVEAVLSAVVIAVGLVFIARGLSSPLHALRTVEEYDVLLSLAHGKLLELEAERALTPPLAAEPAGIFQPPHQAYRWTLSADPHEGWTDRDGMPVASDVTLTVQRIYPPAPAVTLRTVWLSEWVSAQ